MKLALLLLALSQLASGQTAAAAAAAQGVTADQASAVTAADGSPQTAPTDQADVDPMKVKKKKAVDPNTPKPDIPEGGGADSTLPAPKGGEASYVKALDDKVTQLEAENKRLQAELAKLSVKCKVEPAPAEPKVCSTLSTCQECTGAYNCGWCAGGEMACMDGSIRGPAAGNCTLWDYGFCTGEACDKYTSCDRCVQDPFCGYCRTAQTCTEGNDIGPLFGKCKDWEHGQCGSSKATQGEDGQGDPIQGMKASAHDHRGKFFKQASLDSTVN